VTARPRPPRRTVIDERAFHRWLARALPAGRTGRLPLGDDAAALDLPRGSVAVVSTDALVQGVHFLTDSPPADVGAAASAVSLSDVAANGGSPLAVFLAVVVPRGSEQRWAERLAVGAEREAARYGAHLLGGDTKPGPTRVVVSTVVGAARPGRLVGRRGARPGDLLVTTGVVGRGGAAARKLATGGAERGRAVRAMLRITPRVREGVALARFVHAMLDTSDGLAESCRLLAEASRVRLVVHEPRLPLVRSLRGLSAPSRRRAAFYGGDYELLAAVAPPRWPAAQRAVAAAGGRLTVIGRVEAGRGAWLAGVRGEVAMPRAGWRPFGRGETRRPEGGREGRPVSDSRRVHGTFK